MKIRKIYPQIAGMLLLGAGLTACGNGKTDSIAGRTYGVQCYWTGGPNDFSPFVDFNEDGTVEHRDDTATLSGTWTTDEETVVWTLDNPPNNTSFRGTFDRKAISGNISDTRGNTGIFQGAKQ